MTEPGSTASPSASSSVPPTHRGATTGSAAPSGEAPPTEDTFPGGTNIAHAAWKTLDEARQTGRHVINRFNGVLLTAWPDATLTEVHECYDLRRRIQYTERRKAEQGNRWALLTGEALGRVVWHQAAADGRCSCGFSRWSVEHVVHLVINEAAQRCDFRLVDDAAERSA